MAPTIIFGPLAIPLGRFLIMAGFFIALLAGWYLGRKRDVNVEPALTLMLVSGVLGARLVFVAQYLDDYLASPFSILDIRDSGFNFPAGLALSALCGVFLAWRQHSLREPLALSVMVGVLLWGGGTAAYQLGREPVDLPTLPPLSFSTLDGTFINLHELNDRPMVLNLWATWCPPCRREMPVFEAAQQRETDVVFVFVNQGEDEERVLDYLLDDDLQLENVLLDFRSVSSQLLNARALPSTFYFDSQGNMVDAHLGEVSAATLNRSLRQLRRTAK